MAMQPNFELKDFSSNNNDENDNSDKGRNKNQGYNPVNYQNQVHSLLSYL